MKETRKCRDTQYTKIKNRKKREIQHIKTKMLTEYLEKDRGENQKLTANARCEDLEGRKQILRVDREKKVQTMSRRRR